MKRYLITVAETIVSVYRVAAEDEAAAFELLQRRLDGQEETYPAVRLWDNGPLYPAPREEWKIEDYTGPPDPPTEDDDDPIPF